MHAENWLRCAESYVTFILRALPTIAQRRPIDADRFQVLLLLSNFNIS